MAEVIEINDLNQLGPHRMAWNALFAETPKATFFQTFDWLSIYWQHFGKGQKLRVLVVRAAGQPIGILPLCVRRERRRLGVVQTLGYPLDGWGTVFGPIGNNPSATLTLGLKHVARTPRDWDRVELDWVAHDSSDRGRTRRAMELSGLRPTLEPSQSTSVVDLPGDWEEYLSGLTSKTRHEVRRHLRRAEEAPEVRYVRHRPAPLREGDGDPRWDLFDACEKVAAASWQSGSTDGNTLSHRKYRGYYRDAHAAAARLGMLDMNVLFIAGQPVAFNYNYVLDGRVLGLRMGYDQGAECPKGVGLSLVAMLLRDSCRRADANVDFGAGGQDFKRRLRTGQLHTHRLTHTRALAWRSQALRLGHWLRREASVKQKTA